MRYNMSKKVDIFLMLILVVTVFQILYESLSSVACSCLGLGVHSIACDINMGIYNILLYKIVQEGESLGGACPPGLSNISKIGIDTFDSLARFLEQRHRVERLAPLEGGAQEIVLQLLILGEESRGRVSERDQNGSGECAHLDHDGGAMFLLGERHAVGQHQPPLRVGVADLDGQTLVGLDDVSGPVAVAADAVLGPAHGHADVHFQLEFHDRPERAQNRACSTFVHVHVLHHHLLDVVSSRIECDTLSDQAHHRR